MFKRQFISQVAEKSHLSAAQVRAVLDATQEFAAEQLIKNGTVRLHGLVTLKVLTRASRVARNPKTGEECPVATGHTVKARPVTGLSAGVTSRLQVATVDAS
jgi:DNA-binding protein HU-beta